MKRMLYETFIEESKNKEVSLMEFLELANSGQLDEYAYDDFEVKNFQEIEEKYGFNYAHSIFFGNQDKSVHTTPPSTPINMESRFQVKLITKTKIEMDTVFKPNKLLIISNTMQPKYNTEQTPTIQSIVVADEEYGFDSFAIYYVKDEVNLVKVYEDSDLCS